MKLSKRPKQNNSRARRERASIMLQYSRTDLVPSKRARYPKVVGAAPGKGLSKRVDSAAREAALRAKAAQEKENAKRMKEAH